MVKIKFIESIIKSGSKALVNLGVKKKDARPLFLGTAGLAGLYLMTRTASAETASTGPPSPYEKLTRSQTSSFNAHLYADTNNLELNEAGFNRMMRDIATIDGKTMMSYQLGFTNPSIVMTRINLAYAKIMKDNIDDALNSRIKLTAQHKFVLNQWMAEVNRVIPTLENSSLNGSDGMVGRMLTGRATRKMTRSLNGLKSWSKKGANQIHQDRLNDVSREMTLENMRQGVEINLYQPLDSLDITSAHKHDYIEEADDIGSALVNTRHSMRRLL
tara:strand:+ start:1631 stop:2449 length:819 start_codon:yes stop_codon:yes gene_type:complete